MTCAFCSDDASTLLTVSKGQNTCNSIKIHPGGASRPMWTDRRQDTTKLISAFRKFTNALKIV